MADSKLADLTESTTPADTDLLYLVADPATTPLDRKVTVANLRASMWIERADEPGTATTNWTGVAGTWASNGTVIQQTNAGVTDARMRLTAGHTYARSAGFLSEAEVRIPSGGAGDQYAGIGTVKNEGTLSGWIWRIQYESAAWQACLTRPGGNDIKRTLGSGGLPAGGFDTWYTLRLVIVGAMASAYINDIYYASVVTDAAAEPESTALWSYTAAADYRNYEMWTLDVPLPA